MVEPSEKPKRKASVVAGFLFLFGATWFCFFTGDMLEISSWVNREHELRLLLQNQPYLVYASAFSIYAIATGLSIPGAAILSLVLGWYLGFSRGLILVSFASTTGASLAFLSSRYLLRERILNRYGKRLQIINEHLEREGSFYLFTLRLIPAIPFFLINLLMGLTPMRIRTFWWVSQIGMLPGTIAYIYAGSNLPDLKTLTQPDRPSILTPELVGGFVIIGLLPWLAKSVLSKIRESKS